MADPLYEDGQLSVQLCSNHDGAHILSIGNDNYFLNAGILKDLAQTPRGKLEAKLETANPGIILKAQEKGVTADSIGIALAQARVKELEEALSHVYANLSLYK